MHFRVASDCTVTVAPETCEGPPLLKNYSPVDLANEGQTKLYERNVGEADLHQRAVGKERQTESSQRETSKTELNGFDPSHNIAMSSHAHTPRVLAHAHTCFRHPYSQGGGIVRH